MHTRRVSLAFLVGLVACGPSSSDLPSLDTGRDLQTRGVVPCAHPMPKKAAFDATTAVGVSPQEAFAELEASCSAPLKWNAAGDDMNMNMPMDISVEVTLDRESALEITYPVRDTCTNKLTVEGNIVLSTPDGKLHIEGRGTFTYVPGGGPADDPLDPIAMPAELSVSAEALQRTGYPADPQGRYTARIGGAGAACAGEIRTAQDAASDLVGSWSANGCPLGEKAIDVDTSPALAVRMEQLAKAWRDAHLDAAWDTGDETQLELDVHARDAPRCQTHNRIVTVPVDVRYGTSDGVIPVHDALGRVDLALLSDEPTVRLVVSEQTDCTMQPQPGYCESSSSAEMRLEIQYPNTPSHRLAQLVVNGQVRGSARGATSQHVLTIAGAPYSVECLLEFDCAANQMCLDGFCRAPNSSQAQSHCTLDSDCSSGWHCDLGTCRF